jgi:hypothetical protein
MDSSKLLKAIQILIKEELKEQLPTLIKESVKAEVKRILAENVKPQQPKKQSTGLSMAKAILGEDRTPKVVEEVQYVKDAVLNQILNETRVSSMDKTVSFNNPNVAGAGLAGLRAEMASKMGYGDMNSGPSKGGLGVTTGLAGLDRILNRDNSALVKAFDKSKGGWRPGM